MSGARPPDEVLAFYALGLEAGRLEVDYFPLERARTPSLLGASPHLLAIARRPATDARSPTV